MPTLSTLSPSESVRVSPRSILTRVVGTALVVVVGVFGDKASAQGGSGGVRWLPTRYLNDRFALAPVSEVGDTVLLYLDTGGGANMFWAKPGDRFRLATRHEVLGKDSLTLVDFPEFARAAGIPAPGAASPVGAPLMIMPQPNGLGRALHGFLGHTWFADRVWVLDYPMRRVGLVDTEARPAGGMAPLGFRVNTSGRRETHFPRIRIRVDGDSIDMLFDSGATTTITSGAAARIGVSGGEPLGTSFITDTLARAWRARHPDWLWIDSAEINSHAPMIRVPTVEAAGYTVGPVWFTVRPDRNFHDYMSQWMDRRIEGALGGSALKYFGVTLDYPRAVAYFEKQ